ncbi:MAG: hypothetical protein ACQKBW_10380 [Puniceicoccales bacterium]
MFRLTGRIVNVYVSPKGVNRKTGEEYGGQDKVQIMGQIPLSDGQFKMELIDLTTDQGDVLKRLENQEVTCPVAFYSARGAVGYYIPKGHKIQPVRAQQ